MLMFVMCVRLTAVVSPRTGLVRSVGAGAGVVHAHAHALHAILTIAVCLRSSNASADTSADASSNASAYVRSRG